MQPGFKSDALGNNVTINGIAVIVLRSCTYIITIYKILYHNPGPLSFTMYVETLNDLIVRSRRLWPNSGGSAFSYHQI